MSRISILVTSGVVLLTLGVARPRHIGYQDNATWTEPIVSRADERRICAELCTSGLGGEPCGADCFDMVPRTLSLSNSPQYVTGPDQNESSTRKGACPVLCANRLGYPLCNCDIPAQDWRSQFFQVNYYQICSHYCVEYDYQIYGCDVCSSYKRQNADPGFQGLIATQETRAINWTQWCGEMCHTNDGGAACNCDLMPMMAHI